MVLTVTLNPAIDKILILKRFEVHKLHRVTDDEVSEEVAGGKGVNIALNLQQLGSSVIASGFAGGHPGHLLCDNLRTKGVTTSFIFTEGKTRANTSIIDLENKTLTEINDLGQEVSEEDLSFFIDNYTQLVNRVSIVVLAGSLPKGTPKDLYKLLIEIANKKGVKTIVHTAPEYIDPVLGSSAFLLNPDMRSHHFLAGKPIDGVDQFISVGKEIIRAQKEVEFVLFTHRIQNVVAITHGKSYVVHPRGLKIVNMLGYADAYLAGFIHAYNNKKEIPDVLRYASASGLTNVESLYKEIKDKKTVFENIKRIDVEEIKWEK